MTLSPAGYTAGLIYWTATMPRIVNLVQAVPVVDPNHSTTSAPADGEGGLSS